MKKANYIVVILLVCLFMGILYACNNTPSKQNNSIEYGLRFEPPLSEELSSDHCAYRADTNEFCIDNVSLTFYYGWAYDVNCTDGRDIPEAELYFYNAKQPGAIYSIKKINDYISDKYKCYLVYNDDFCVTEIQFEHSETITIPQEVFIEEEGMIYFAIDGEDINNRDNRREEEEKHITSSCIYYHKNGDKVIISCQKFTDEE